MRDDADTRVGYAWVPKTLEGDGGYLLRQLWAPSREGAASCCRGAARAVGRFDGAPCAVGC